jgi:hypothetical protein
MSMKTRTALLLALAANAATNDDVTAIATALGGTRIIPQGSGVTAVVRPDGRTLKLLKDSSGNYRVAGGDSDLTFVRQGEGQFVAAEKPARRLTNGYTVVERAADLGEVVDSQQRNKARGRVSR